MTVIDTLSQALVTTRSDLDFDAILRAYETVPRILPETLAWSCPLLNVRVGVEITVKHENIQPTGAFKVCDGMTLMVTLSPEKWRRDVVTVSTGNHVQFLAWAGAYSEVPVTVVVPVDTPARKVVAVRVLGTRAVVKGETMCESLAHAGALALREGIYTAFPGDEPAIVLGHATVYFELFCRHPDLEAVYALVGSGSGAAGAYLVHDTLTPGRRVIGIQSSVVPTAYCAWTSGEPAIAHSHTRVAGLAAGVSFTLIQSVPGRSLNDFILANSDAVQSTVSLLVTHAHILAEGAGAASLVGLIVNPARQGHYVVVCTGGSADGHELAGISAGIFTRAAVGTDTALNC